MKFSMETSANFQQMPKSTDNIFKVIQFLAVVEVLCICFQNKSLNSLQSL